MSLICSTTQAVGVIFQPGIRYETRIITFADSPFSMVRKLNVVQIILVDATDGETIVVLYSHVENDSLEIKKTDISSNKVKYQGNGFNIDDLAERELLGQYNSDRLIADRNQWTRE